jgi:tRNA dimethylallyltransferase
MHKCKKLIVIVGPTASGKTAFAIKKAKELNTEIVSADSRQIYSELNIGVAKPDDNQLNEVRHHLIGHVSILDSYDVRVYEKDALRSLDTIFEKSDFAILAGGTGLYVNAVLFGLDEIPDVDDQILDELNKNWKEAPQKLLNELQKFDPEYFHQVDLSNPRRVLRALGVLRQTGKKFSSFRTGTFQKRNFDTEIIKILPERESLYQVIEKRVDLMIETGLEKEAENLFALKHLKALDTVGYREWWPYFEGFMGKDEVINSIKQHTRNYAKRQITWWRKYL